MSDQPYARLADVLVGYSTEVGPGDSVLVQAPAVAQPLALDYDMEKTASGWKVYDVRIGGISLVANYRSEFSNLVRDSGIDGLIGSLQAKNRSLDRSLEKK